MAWALVWLSGLGATVLGLAGRAAAQPAAGRPWPRGAAIQNGLQAEVILEEDRANAAGYRPLTMRLTTWPQGKPSAERRRFEVVFSTQFSGRVTHRMAMEMELPAGETAAERTVDLPVTSSGYRWVVDVFEDGRRLPDLSGERMPQWTTVVGQQRWNDDHPRPCVLLLHPEADPSWNQRNHSFAASASPFFGMKADEADPPAPSPAGVSRIVEASPSRVSSRIVGGRLNQLANMDRVDFASAATAPRTWLEWSGYDIVVTPYSELRRLAGPPRPALEGLRQWVECGGLLCVTDAAGNAALEGVSELLAGEGADRDGGSVWTIGSKLLGAELAAGPPQAVASDAAAADAPYRWRPLMAGRVAAVRAPDLFSDPRLAASVLNDASILHWDPSRRWGGLHFWTPGDLEDFDLRGVGQSPVFIFLALITLFVVLIGPVNCFVLYKLRRLQWMAVTTPLIALAIVTLIFVFAVLTEGFGASVRVVGATWLDQVSGRAVHASRQSYYSASGRRTMAFPEDAAVMLHQDAVGGRGTRTRYRLQWTSDGRLLLSDDYLPTRQLVQYTVVRPQVSAAALLFTRQGADDLRVRNKLGANIRWLAACDREGNRFWTEELRADAAAELQAASSTGAAARVIQQASEQLSEGFGDGLAAAVLTQLQWSPGAFRANAIVRRCRDILRPGEYIAVVDRDPHAPIGLADATQRDCVYLIHGRWW